MGSGRGADRSLAPRPIDSLATGLHGERSRHPVRFSDPARRDTAGDAPFPVRARRRVAAIRDPSKNPELDSHAAETAKERRTGPHPALGGPGWESARAPSPSPRGGRAGGVGATQENRALVHAAARFRGQNNRIRCVGRGHPSVVPPRLFRADETSRVVPPPIARRQWDAPLHPVSLGPSR